MKVLVACEYSGVVREAFNSKGHDAWSCDLLPTEIPGKHIQGDVLNILNDGWDLIISHPPCTYLSNAGANHLFKNKKLNKERYEKGLNGKNFFMLFYNHPCEKICIENPVPSSIFKLPKHSQVIQPYFFGDPFQKKTYLWLKGLPPLISTDIRINPESTITAKWYNNGGKKRQSNRSKTFNGIAQAMAEQWG